MQQRAGPLDFDAVIKAADELEKVLLPDHTQASEHKII